jgi:hypothetical protein
MQIDDFRLPRQRSIHNQAESVATYVNDAGDTLSLNYFAKEPDIAADISDTEALRAFYRSAAEFNQVAMVEVDTAQLASLPAVRTVLKARLQPRGFAFIGSYTLPFSDRSYVIKVQSLEQGITGVREAAVMAMQPAPIEIDELTGKLVGWEQDPYDPSYRGSFMRNRADDPEFDPSFPDHPLSKVRAYLRELSIELGVSQRVRAGRPFKYKAPRQSIWSRLWR